MIIDNNYLDALENDMLSDLEKSKDKIKTFNKWNKKLNLIKFGIKT